MMMQERQDKIIELVNQHHRIDVVTLARELGVSQVTIRKDLDALVEKRIIQREHGYAVINETNAGTKEDPIPYSGNVALESGKYYSQDGVIYLCNRDTEIPVYQALKDLVGLYVEEVTE